MKKYTSLAVGPDGRRRRLVRVARGADAHEPAAHESNPYHSERSAR